MMHRLLMLSLCAALVSSAAFAQAPTGKVTVVTSFAKDVTDPVKKAFETATPGVTLEVQNRNTNAGVKYLEETKSSNQVDLFWASAPDAFEVLKGKGLLQKYAPKASGIPEKIGQFPINDPAGFYFGFAASGYGIMWNERYVKANKLPDPKEWQDLAKPVYYDHVSIAAPSRSGTTHLTVEAVLQGEGWAKGWGTIKAMAGNFRNITERSFGVPEAVNSGQVGYGIVIDFFAFSAQASGFPVKFIYPTVTTIVPANVGIVANAPNKAAAEAFVEFLLSPAGQQVLFEPGIRRLPVNPDVYAKAPADYPNPFKDPRLNSMIKFDVAKSEARNDVVDVLFDQLISFQLDSLKAATKAIHEAEAAIAKKDNAQARALVAQARELIAAMPVDEAAASARETASAFTGGKQKGARQAELEQQWAVFAKERYAQAQAKAEEAAKLAK
ncbi:ABC transporter substrate-binding protein [Bradyrhizobium sp. JYMT SZCCT0428]|uniref:ABC transporter substrate-binding protein n=1 Tax=Bradyrhizobium sp. JYMT SZCCT0428 TaxID=2807673 RepID=UPI001BAD5860|nr:extracellular solute-binding protein [Bradyrhizobium sp. JYMT SZCCT0428]MBR1156533.1 extracellular solute-binding protein [Bradyrhizobium sp. JYMT SZCCT0428]